MRLSTCSFLLELGLLVCNYNGVLDFDVHVCCLCLLVLILVAAQLLSGCSIGPQYKFFRVEVLCPWTTLEAAIPNPVHCL